MPVRVVASSQQVIDRRARRTPTVRRGNAMGLAIEAALRMRLQAKRQDHRVEAERRREHRTIGQSLFLRSRTSAKVATVSPGWPIAAWSRGSSARRKGLVFFSRPIVVGTVGMFFARFASI